MPICAAVKKIIKIKELMAPDCAVCKKQERPALELNKAKKPQAGIFPCYVFPSLCNSIEDLGGKAILSAPVLVHKENQFC